MALEREVSVFDLSEKLGIDSWEIQRILGNLRIERIISSKDESIRLLNNESESVKLLNNEKVQLLIKLSKETDVKKTLHESNEMILSFLTEPIAIGDLIIETGLSRATVYRALKDFKDLKIIEKTFCGIPLSDNFQYQVKLNENHLSVIEFANFLKKEREKLEESRWIQQQLLY